MFTDGQAAEPRHFPSFWRQRSSVGSTDRRTRAVSSPLDATLHACHPRPVNGYQAAGVCIDKRHRRLLLCVLRVLCGEPRLVGCGPAALESQCLCGENPGESGLCDAAQSTPRRSSGPAGRLPGRTEPSTKPEKPRPMSTSEPPAAPNPPTPARPSARGRRRLADQPSPSTGRRWCGPFPGLTRTTWPCFCR